MLLIWWNCHQCVQGDIGLQVTDQHFGGKKFILGVKKRIFKLMQWIFFLLPNVGPDPWFTVNNNIQEKEMEKTTEG